MVLGANLKHTKETRLYFENWQLTPMKILPQAATDLFNWRLGFFIVNLKRDASSNERFIQGIDAPKRLLCQQSIFA